MSTSSSRPTALCALGCASAQANPAPRRRRERILRTCLSATSTSHAARRQQKTDAAVTPRFPLPTKSVWSVLPHATPCTLHNAHISKRPAVTYCSQIGTRTELDHLCISKRRLKRLASQCRRKKGKRWPGEGSQRQSFATRYSNSTDQACESTPAGRCACRMDQGVLP